MEISMRYYELHYPGVKEPGIATNARKLKDLPTGTRCHAIITDRDGSLAETYEIPVVNGRVQFPKRAGIHNPKLARTG